MQAAQVACQLERAALGPRLRLYKVRAHTRPTRYQRGPFSRVNEYPATIWVSRGIAALGSTPVSDAFWATFNEFQTG